MKCSSLFLVFLLAALSGCGGGDKSGASPAAMTPSAVAPPVAVAASAAAPAVIGADSDSVAPMASPAALLDGVASAKTIDLDGDGNGDLLWVNERTGQTWGWLMNGLGIKSSGELLTHADFRVVAAGDLDGDGKTDLIWQNAVTGQTAAWLMNGLTIRSSSVLLTDPNFRVSGVADFNGDGKADIVWYNAATGQTVIWLMNGLNIVSSAVVLTHPDFKVVATPDLNGDGKADIIWYNAKTGQTVAWIMNGLTITSNSLLLTDPDFRVIATPDTNGDGRADLVWYNAATGQTGLWLMNGTTVLGSRILLTHPSFKVVATPDLDGNGKSDLLWYSAATGQTVAWLMDGLNIVSNATLLTHPSFTVVATPKLNADKRSDLVWYSPVTGETALWLMNGTSLSSSVVALRDTFFRVSSAQIDVHRNSPPTAKGGATQRVTMGTLVTLDSSTSFDVDGDALTYRWTISSAPTGSTFVGQGANGAKVTFTPDVAGIYAANVSVSDGLQTSIGTTTVTASAPIPIVGWTLSGTVTMPENSAVDSDTSNPFQANRRRNDPRAQAQALSTPVQLLGSVNEPLTGDKDAADYAAGDEDDYYAVTLQAGQTVELDFAADPANADLDLYILDETTGSVRGQSIGVRRYECVRVAAAGRYQILVTAFKGASIYSLRIGAPGEANSCVNSTAAASSIVAGQVLAKAGRSDGALDRARALVAGGAVTNALSDLDASYPALLGLPADADNRRSGLQRLAALVAGSAQERNRIASAAAVRAAPGSAAAQRPAELQAIMDTVAYAKTLAGSGAFEYAEPNTYQESQALVGTYPPNDRSYPLQRWHYEMIQMPSAMSRLVGLAAQPAVRPLVAVIDTGIVVNHPDLAPQIEDGFSFITVTRSGDGNAASPNDPSTAADHPSWHGSHTAGTVAAATFDGIGAASVAPMAKLMPLRVFASSGEGVRTNSNDVVQAILYAAGLDNNSGHRPARRADVINLSLGSTSSCPSFYQDAITRALAQGTIVVVSTGNDAANDQGRSAPVGSPANCVGVIAVSALDAARRPSYYSNSGAQVVVGAPGGDMRVSTTGNGAADGVYSTTATFDANGVRQPSVTGLQGTSMAAPHVAGVMALMRYVNPAITPAQVMTLFAQGRLTSDIYTAGFDNYTGYGLIDARKAIDAAIELAGGSAPAPTGAVVAVPSSLDFGSVRTSADIDLRLNATGTERVLSVTSSSAAITVVATTVDATTRLGTYTVTVNRTSLATGATNATLTVTTSASRTFTVPLAVQKVAAGASGADFGRVYVLLLDPITGNNLYQANVNAVNGRYSWTITGVKASSVKILAGTDTNNDGFLCDLGEACGAYPSLSNSLPIVELNANMSNVDISISLLGGIGAAAVSDPGAPVGKRREPEDGSLPAQPAIAAALAAGVRAVPASAGVR